MALLKKIGVDYAQGYYVHIPQPVSELGRDVQSFRALSPRDEQE